MQQTKQFLDYVALQEHPVLTYCASDMILAGHSNASYLNKKNARSRIGGHWFMSEDKNFPPNNGTILNIAQLIKKVMTNRAEAELGGIYINTREAVYIQNILVAMGFLQP